MSIQKYWILWRRKTIMIISNIWIVYKMVLSGEQQHKNRAYPAVILYSTDGYDKQHTDNTGMWITLGRFRFYAVCFSSISWHAIIVFGKLINKVVWSRDTFLRSKCWQGSILLKWNMISLNLQFRLYISGTLNGGLSTRLIKLNFLDVIHFC